MKKFEKRWSTAVFPNLFKLAAPYRKE